MLRSPKSWSLTGVLAAAIIASASSVANAAFSYSIVSDTSTRDTTYLYPVVQTITTNPGALYTANGGPTVTNGSNSITFDFTGGLSAAYKATTSPIIIEQTTDGKLVMNLHFDTPVSISANIFEGGLYNISGNGAVSVTGGEFVIEAVNPIPVETRTSGLSANFNGSGGWTATAATTPFNGVYQDYRIVIDNDLDATATNGGTAAIYKKAFILQIIPGGGGTPPIPEPASLGILALGAVGLIVRRRR